MALNYAVISGHPFQSRVQSGFPRISYRLAVVRAPAPGSHPIFRMVSPSRTGPSHGTFQPREGGTLESEMHLAQTCDPPTTWPIHHPDCNTKGDDQ